MEPNFAARLTRLTLSVASVSLIKALYLGEMILHMYVDIREVIKYYRLTKHTGYL